MNETISHKNNQKIQRKLKKERGKKKKKTLFNFEDFILKN
jgi:hypothetical protein